MKPYPSVVAGHIVDVHATRVAGHNAARPIAIDDFRDNDVYILDR